MSRPWLSSRPLPAQDLPREELSHVAGELVSLPVLHLLTSNNNKNKEKQIRAGKEGDTTAPARQYWENCSLKPGTSVGNCSLFFSRGEAAAFPPVPLNRNFWISVSEAFSLLSV